MRKIYIHLINSTLLLTLFAGCAPSPVTPSPIPAPPTTVSTELPEEAATQEPLHLKIDIRNIISFAPLFIARDEGYFAKQGIEVELENFGASVAETIPLLVAGKIDVAGPTLTTSVFNAILQGNNLKIVADKGFLNPDNCATDAWVASKTLFDSGALETPSAINGKKIVMTPGGTVEYSLDILLAENNLTQDAVVLSNIADSTVRVEGLNNGSVDISMLSEPWITNAQTTGAGEVWVPLSDLIPNMPLGTIVFGSSILEDNPEAGTRFMIAYLKGVEQFNQGKTDRNIEIIADYTKLSPEDIKASCWTSFKPDGTIITETMLAFQEWALEKGYVDGSLNLEQFWTSQFIDEAAKKLNQ